MTLSKEQLQKKEEKDAKAAMKKKLQKQVKMLKK